MGDGIRNEYERDGVEGFYLSKGEVYRNPHEGLIGTALAELVTVCGLGMDEVLDLAAGSGEVTLAVGKMGGKASGIDPYTHEAYKQRTGKDCERLTFEQVAGGAIRGRKYSLVVCSFAMHLVEVSRLPLLCGALREVTDVLVILTPHKRPSIRKEWGWELVEERMYTSGEPDYFRCRGRVYRGL